MSEPTRCIRPCSRSAFVAEPGRPYDLAPAYDMTPMALAPRSGGSLPDTLPEAAIHASVDNPAWRRAKDLAQDFLARIGHAEGFSQRFGGGIAALERHFAAAGGRIGRLG
ncbi:MAG: hypothetical protein HZB71_06120 [Betaproteobacteria bacterium]|nr:hypothetical protein [Betaproteobacteria bacterium]